MSHCTICNEVAADLTALIDEMQSKLGQVGYTIRPSRSVDLVDWLTRLQDIQRKASYGVPGGPSLYE